MVRVLVISMCAVPLLVLGLTACDKEGARAQRAGKPKPIANLAKKKAVLVIAPSDFRDEELQEPLSLLRACGCEVAIACSSLNEAVGMLGAKVKPEVLLKDVRAADYDAVVFVGGVGASVYFDDPTAHALAKEALERSKVLGAICIAPSILARAGVLKGKRATAWESQKDDLERCGAKWADEAAVRDGLVVTANGPKAAKQFAELLVKTMAQPAAIAEPAGKP